MVIQISKVAVKKLAISTRKKAEKEKFKQRQGSFHSSAFKHRERKRGNNTHAFTFSLR